MADPSVRTRTAFKGFIQPLQFALDSYSVQKLETKNDYSAMAPTMQFPPPEPILSGLAKAARRGSNCSASTQDSGVTTSASSSLDDSVHYFGVGEKVFPTTCDESIGTRFGMNLRTECESSEGDVCSQHLRALSTESITSTNRSSLTAAMLETHEGELDSNMSNFPVRKKIQMKLDPEVTRPQISHSGEFDFFLDLDDHSGCNLDTTATGTVLDNHGHHPMSLTAHNLPQGHDSRLRARSLSGCSKNFEAREEEKEDLMFDIEV